MKYKSETQLLHEETGIKLWKVDIKIGQCKAIIFRELTWNDGEIQLLEWDTLPQHWKRWIIIDSILPPQETYYQKNKEKLNEYSKQWKKNNKEKWNQYQKEKAKLRQNRQIK